MFTEPLDLNGLTAVSDGQDVPRHATADLRVGHLHLQVGDLVAARAFYGDVVGFEVMATYPGAAFLAAGGYHHHVAVNTWAGEGVGPAPDHTAGLRQWSALVPSRDAIDAVRRPRAGGWWPHERHGRRIARPARPVGHHAGAQPRFAVNFSLYVSQTEPAMIDS